MVENSFQTRRVANDGNQSAAFFHDEISVSQQRRNVTKSNVVQVIFRGSDPQKPNVKSGSPLSQKKLRQQIQALPPNRRSGPIQVIHKLLEFWKLDSSDATGLLGFEENEFVYVELLLEGREHLRGRDVKERISNLLYIRRSLSLFFQNIEVENEWLREPRAMLNEQTPMSMLLGGSMDDLLWVREYVDRVTGL